ncbi:hypothetical protein O0880_14560 [Janthinobacterium sp. SUN118]|uniref:hypothetical protein n=1 Tax=Janthinobacterium sp. SUN118 TaxID=3004100 RepID=UPI0025B17D44|nr:hypothetical protein [Janthinobacterium sp. SUN118]MDN2710644.1 hypothetical protein [Janthinobacterium sp. SUN118]
MTKELTPDEIIDALGGTSKTARLCGVKDPSVSEWRKEGIPPARLMFLRLARPKVFASLETDCNAKSDEALLARATTRRATDSVLSPGHAGRQLPPTNAIFDTVPARAAVGIDVGAKP